MGTTYCCNYETEDKFEIVGDPTIKKSNQNQQDIYTQFDEWLDSIEQRPSKYIDIFTIKDLIVEASKKYSRR